MREKNTEIRVAVALVALRFKPIRRSCIAYVLDLQDRFPCPGGDAQLADWRERALELETRCSKLERMFDWDKLGTDLNRKSREQTGGKDFTERLVETNAAGHAMQDEGKKRGGKKEKTEIRTRPGLERVLNGKVAGHSLDGAITISGRSALTIYERLMRAQDGLLTRTSDSVAEREEFSLTVIPVTFAVVRSGLEELGKMADVMTEAGRNPGAICDVLSAIDWMLRGMLQSLFAVVQRFTKATGLRAKHAKQLERLVEEECDRTFGILTEAVLVRLVRSIFPWMERMFERLEQTVDVPMELVGILEGALNAAEQFGFNGVGASVRERVVLEACQELRRLPRRIPADGGSKSVRERKQRLAKKEAVWYLGTVLQRNSTTAVSARVGSRLVESARLAMLTVVESEFVFGRGCCGIAEE